MSIASSSGFATGIERSRPGESGRTTTPAPSPDVQGDSSGDGE